MIFCETRHHAQAHVTFGALCPFFGREKNTDGRAVGLFSLAIVCYGYFCWGWLLLMFLFFFLKIVFLHCWLSHLIPRPCQQPEFHWWLHPLVLFIFFQSLLKTNNRLPCLDYYVWLGTVSEMYYHWQQNRSKATMWLLYKNSSYSRVPKTLLLDWRLYVACYYPTTPTDYPNTTRGVSVGSSVAVNIKFCGYLWFFSISFVWII